METKDVVSRALLEEVDCTGTLPEIKIKDFAEKLTAAIGALFDCLVRDKTIREHPVWGKLIPFEMPLYGQGNSVGHCIRPDLVITKDGLIKICELDCAPSGRGFLLKLLKGYSDVSRKCLSSFASWYESIVGPNTPITYGTGTQTICYEETDMFSRLLREEFGVNIFAKNVDEDCDSAQLIDRLFYRSELRGDEKVFPHNKVITTEPYLDSKMLLALVHDQSLEKFFETKIGKDTFQFLKKAVPETYSLDLLRLAHAHTEITLKIAKSFGLNEYVFATLKSYPSDILSNLYAPPQKGMAAERSRWLIKTGDVESETCWGSRSVVLGARAGAQDFMELLRGHTLTVGKNNSEKHIGNRSILQRFYQSKDFTQEWKDVVTGTTPGLYDRSNPFFTESLLKDEHVYARVTFFMLLDMVHGNHSYTPVGEMTLRRQPLAHGASDAMYLPFILS